MTLHSRIGFWPAWMWIHSCIHVQYHISLRYGVYKKYVAIPGQIITKPLTISHAYARQTDRLSDDFHSLAMYCICHKVLNPNFLLLCLE